MTDGALATFDNTYLSKRYGLSELANGHRSDDALFHTQVEQYLRSTVSENTRLAYRSDLMDFISWVEMFHRRRTRSRAI